MMLDMETSIIPILQMGKLRLRAMKYLSQVGAMLR